MDSRIKSLLTPELLSSLNGMELIARVIVEGFMSGSNKSMSIGFGQEFSQYRSYEPGDDLRQLDWKMYARSERYFIKQSEIETNITVKLLLDASNSMAYSESGISKFNYAKVIIACLGYLAKKQGDAFGIAIINQLRLVHLQPQFEQQHFMRFLHLLVESYPESTWKKGPDLEQLYDHHGKEMIIFVSDLYDDDKDILRFVHRLKTKRNEVIVFHLLGKNELSLDMKGNFTFKDLESAATYKINTESVRETYVAKVNAWIAQTRKGFHEKNIHYYQVSMDEPVDEVLRHFMHARKTLV